MSNNELNTADILTAKSHEESAAQSRRDKWDTKTGTKTGTNLRAYLLLFVAKKT